MGQIWELNTEYHFRILPPFWYAYAKVEETNSQRLDVKI